MSEDELSNALENFVTVYAFDVSVLTLAVLWHSCFMIGMGVLTLVTILIFLWSWNGTFNGGVTSLTGTPISTLTDVNLMKGWKMFMYGTVVGVINYLIGLALV
jgi:hypothetical protein